MARGKVTISTHNGSSVAVLHNLRDPKVVAHEPHIDPEGVHEVWHHEDLRAFYERTFGEAQREYDSYARGSRRVGDYLSKIAQDAAEAEAENIEIRKRNKAHKEAGEKAEKLKVAKKPVYEEIIGIYPQDGLEMSNEELRELLRLHVMGDGTPEHPSWQERHPGLRVVGIYYHADEPDGGGPHVHLDYVPVAEFSKGMKVQNSLEGALKKQGLASGKVMCADGKERLKTAQEKWTDAERDHLQAVCEAAGLDVLHPQRGNKSVHLETAELRQRSQLKAQAEGEALAAGIAAKRKLREELEQTETAAKTRIKAQEDAAAQDREQAALERRTAQEAAQRLQGALSDAQALIEATERLKLTAEEREKVQQQRKELERLQRQQQQRKKLDPIREAMERFENVQQRPSGPTGPTFGK